MDITPWMIHTCTKKSRTGTGAKGDPSFGSASTFRARVEKAKRTMRKGEGRQQVYDFVLVTTTEIKPDDVIWFPSIAGETADDTSSISAGRTPQEIEVASNKSGSYKIWQVYFGG